MVKTLYIESAAGSRLTKLQEREQHKRVVCFFLVMPSETLRHMPNLMDLQDKTIYDVSEGSLSQAIRFVVISW